MVIIGVILIIIFFWLSILFIYLENQLFNKNAVGRTILMM